MTCTVSPPELPTPETRSLIRRLLDALDYTRLGSIYCDEGGDAFWQDRREPVEELGLAWAKALGERLHPGGRSLYVGAGVAELPALLTEACDLGRSCLPTNLRKEECESLNAGLRSIGMGEELQFEARDAGRCGDRGPFDHLCMVSVLVDPECFHWLCGVTYGRVAPVALDVDEFVAERDRARSLVSSLLDTLTLPAVVTTTVEEVPWIIEAAKARGLRVEADEQMLDTAIVGDPIGFLTISKGGE